MFGAITLDPYSHNRDHSVTDTERKCLWVGVRCHHAFGAEDGIILQCGGGIAKAGLDVFDRQLLRNTVLS